MPTRMVDPDTLGPVYEDQRAAWLRLATRGAGVDAEDAVQDAMVAALSGALPLPDEDVPAMCLRLVRTFARQSRRVGRPGRPVGQLPAWEALTALQLRLEVQRAVDTAPGVSAPLIWAWLQGETLPRLAVAHHRTLAAVEAHITRCLAHCAAQLAGYHRGRARRGTPPPPRSSG